MRKPIPELREVLSSLVEGCYDTRNGLNIYQKKIKLVIDLIKHLMLYYEMVIFGVVCLKIPEIVGRAK